MSRYFRHLFYRSFPLLVVIGMLLAFIHLDLLSRIPAFAFMVAPNSDFDHREFIRQNVEPGFWMIQKLTLPKNTYRLRFSIFPGEARQPGAFHAYLVSSTSSTLVAGYTIPLKSFAFDTNTVSIYFPPVEAGDYYLGFRFTETDKGFAGLAATNPARDWNLCGPLWYQGLGKMVRADKSCLWKLTAYRYMSFKEMLERISQYGEVKGFRMVVLFALFAFAFALFWREWMTHMRHPVLVSLLLLLACFAVGLPIVNQRVGSQRFYPISEAPAADMQQYRELLKSLPEVQSQAAPPAAVTAQATLVPLSTPQASPALQVTPTPQATPQATPQVMPGTTPKAAMQTSSSTAPRK